jgi:hypothetical protein
MMEFNVSNFREIDVAMREYFLAQYRFARAAYANDTYSLSAGRSVLSKANEEAMEARLRKLLEPVDQAWNSPTAVINHLRDAANDAGKSDVRGGVEAEKGLASAKKLYLTESFDAVALIDDYNSKPARTRGNSGKVGERGHKALLAEARATKPTDAPATSEQSPAPETKPDKKPAAAITVESANALLAKLDAGEVTAADAVALRNLGIALLRKDGVLKQNPSLALNPMMVAAMFGDKGAQTGLASMFKSGLAKGKVDKISAYAWYSIAAEKVSKTATAKLEELKATMSEDEIKQGNAGIVELKERMAAFQAERGGSASQAAGGGSSTRKRPVQKQYTSIDPAVQLALERLGMDTGQPGTDGPNQFDTTGASTPDGKRGQFTNKAIEDFRASKPEYEDLSEEDLFAEIIKAGDAAYAAKGEGAGQTSDQSAAATDASTPPDLTAQLATQLAAVADKSDAAKDYRVFGIAPDDEKVKAFFLASFVDEKTGKSSLTAEQIESVEVTNGVISSPFIGIAERMLGMTQDNKMDLRLQTALEDETVKAAVIEAFTGTTVSGGATTDVASAGGAGAGNGATPPSR